MLPRLPGQGQTSSFRNSDRFRAAQRPFLIGQMTRVAQLAPVIPTRVLLGPHPKAPANPAGDIESQVIPEIQAVPGRTLRG